MRGDKILAVLATALMALALAACSGGGGGSAGDTGGGGDPGGGDTGGGGDAGDAGDGGGATADTITVNGVVTDQPIPNAIVTLTVNGQSFEAPAPTDAEGRYSVEISSDDPEALVLCEAVDPNGAARFTALLDNFEGFQESADENGDVQDVDITNVTTAQFVLATQLSADGEIDDLDELESVSEQVDPQALLELSAAIKVIVENIDGVVLPEGIDNTQELAEAIANEETTFIEDLEITNPGTLDDAVDLVLTDGNATVEWTPDFVPGVYLPTEGEQLFAFLPGGLGYEQSREEFFDDQDDAAGLAPRESGGGCQLPPFPEVAFDGAPCEGEECPADCEGDDQTCAAPPSEEDCDFGDGDDYDLGELSTLQWSINDAGQLALSIEDQDGTVQSERVTLLSVASSVITVTVDSDRDDAERETNTAVRFAFDAEGFDASTVAGTYMPATEEDEHEVIVFLEDGNGYELDLFSGAQDDSFAWTVDEAGVLRITFADQETSLIYLLENPSPTRMQLLIIDVDANGEVEELFVENVNYDPQIATGPMPDAANTALLAGKTYAEISDDSLSLFTFAQDGNFSEVYQRLEDDGKDVGENQGEWSVDGNAIIRVSFPGEEDEDDADDGAALVTGGLGGEEMAIETIDDDDGSRVINLIRVEAFDETQLLGSWFELGADGVATTSLTFGQDGSGAYEDELGGGQFDWSLDSDGRVRLFPEAREDGPDGVETITLYKLANSDEEMLSVVLVFRLNGELDYDFDVDENESPRDAIETLMLFRAF